MTKPAEQKSVRWEQYVRATSIPVKDPSIPTSYYEEDGAMFEPTKYFEMLNRQLERARIPASVEVPESVNGITTPACFDTPEGYHSWMRHATIAMPPPRPKDVTVPNFCHDCTACHQARMIKAGRCQHPEVTFHTIRNRDGELEEHGVDDPADMLGLRSKAA